MEKLIHTADGKLKSDTPWYLTPGTRVRLVKRDARMGRYEVGGIAAVTEHTAKIQKATERAQGDREYTYVRVNDFRDQVGDLIYAGDLWLTKECVEVVED